MYGLVLLLVALMFVALEIYFPQRPVRVDRWHGWLRNIELLAVYRLPFLLFGFGLPLLAQAYVVYPCWFLAESAPVWRWVLTIAILDLAIYWQHRAFHRVAFFWRFHQVHHSDPHLDVTTAFRFHPIEIWLSFLWKALVIIAFQLDGLAVAFFEVFLVAAAVFHHSNISLPSSLDRILSYVLITPSLHLRHHSQELGESMSHFGFSLTLWDRLFGSYIGPSDREPEIGLANWRQGLGLAELLIRPIKFL